MGKNIAIQVYSVRDDAAADFYGTLKKIKEIGYDGVEFAGLYGNDPEDVKKTCEEFGLVPLSAHVPYLDLIEDPEGTVACYKKAGCQQIVIPYLTEEYRPGAEKFEDLLKGIKVIGEECKKQGITLGYHNHDFEFVKIDGEYALDIIYKVIGPELLQTQVDTCWVKVAGEDPAAYVGKYAGRTPTVHLKDFVGSKSENMYALIGIDENEEKDTQGKFELRPVGKGVQDFPAIIETAKKGGAEWFIVEQDMPSMGLTPMECAEVSFKYLDSIM
ncbi:MAG: sugar phosphate isomerase/epimerase [Lachnospiraceae bacterium]|nr:sugar phosphate isomerase/epimerase [Lachnospiraceae bacterium]